MEKTDVLIIGGGVLGAATGWQLSEAGFQVTLLEMKEIASGASGGNLGQISLVDRTDGWHMRLALESLEIYRELSASFPIDYCETGGITALMDDRQLEAGRAAVERLKELGVEAQMLEGTEISQKEPHFDFSKARAAVYCRREGRIDPFAVTLLFIELGKRKGMKVHSFTRVTAFEKANGKITAVLTEKRAFAAELVINAAGAWSRGVGRLAGTDIPLHSNRGTALVSIPVPRLISGPVVGGGFLLHDAQSDKPEKPLHIGLAVNQTGHGSIIIGQATIEKEPDDRQVDLNGLVLTARKFLAYFPGLCDLEIIRAWSVATSHTSDSLPVFGFSDDVPNMLHIAGFKGAFTVAPAVAQRVRSILVQGNASFPREFSPNRTTIRKD